MQSQPPAHVPVLQLVQRIWPLVLVVVVLVFMASGSLYLVSAVRASKCYLTFILDMDRSTGFGSNPSD